MALKIRLARGGAKKRPFYRIVIAEASAPRDGRYVERVGTYNPMVPKDHEQRLTLNGERISFWMSKGAQPTERVHKMLASAGLMTAPALRDQPKKSAIGKKRAEREAAAAEAKAKKEALKAASADKQNALKAKLANKGKKGKGGGGKKAWAPKAPKEKKSPKGKAKKTPTA